MLLIESFGFMHYALWVGKYFSNLLQNELLKDIHLYVLGRTLVFESTSVAAPTSIISVASVS